MHFHKQSYSCFSLHAVIVNEMFMHKIQCILYGTMYMYDVTVSNNIGTSISLETRLRVFGGCIIE